MRNFRHGYPVIGFTWKQVDENTYLTVVNQPFKVEGDDTLYEAGDALTMDTEGVYTGIRKKDLIPQSPQLIDKPNKTGKRGKKEK